MIISITYSPEEQEQAEAVAVAQSLAGGDVHVELIEKDEMEPLDGVNTG